MSSGGPRLDVRVDDPEWLRAAYERATIPEIADELGVTVRTVSRRFAMFGITARSVGERAAWQRPRELNDPDWLRDRYQRRSSRDIADELAVNPQRVLAALHRHGIIVRSGPDTLRMRHPGLHDPVALAARVADTSVAAVATELGVAPITVRAALQRHGVHSVHRYNGKRPIRPPPSHVLEQWWVADETIKGVARRGGVSVNTAAVWLAQIGIFVNDTPAISRSDLLIAMDAGESIEIIRRRHHVTDRTVVIELHRHGLFEAHRQRHITARDDRRSPQVG